MPYAEREKNVLYNRMYYAANKKKWRTYRANWHKKHRSRSIRLMRSYILKAKYGLTIGQYEDMVIFQGGKCAICGTDKPGGNGRKLNVDHCHKTGNVRGVLCFSCNAKLGWFEKNRESIERYLDKNEPKN
jgi:hypothetical protein